MLRQAPCAALLGTGVFPAQAAQAQRESPLLSAPRSSADPPDPAPSLRRGFHHQWCAQPLRRCLRSGRLRPGGCGTPECNGAPSLAIRPHQYSRSACRRPGGVRSRTGGGRRFSPCTLTKRVEPAERVGRSPYCVIGPPVADPEACESADTGATDPSAPNTAIWPINRTGPLGTPLAASSAVSSVISSNWSSANVPNCVAGTCTGRFGSMRP